MPRTPPVVLVVDDEPLIRLAAIDFLEDIGCVAVEAPDAEQAIRILEARHDIRLVLTDVDMPGTMDGLKLAHFVRERWPPIHLIIASGKALLEEAQLPNGAMFFSKPYEFGRISSAIAGLLAD